MGISWDNGKYMEHLWKYMVPKMEEAINKESRRGISWDNGRNIVGISWDSRNITKYTGKIS